ncbi:MAG: FadR family transcriptional regulator [Clostridia bacterium]|nr:FadR family transcriptional regulator [Clostridia bacterium]
MSYSMGATDHALDYICQRIRSGEWAEGSKIPTEDQLCAQLDMSRIAVRQAIEKLASLSVLTKIQGSGTYVNADKDVSIMGLIYFPVTKERLLTVLEFRRMFDPYNTQLFINSATPEELARLEENYRNMEAAGRAGREAEFHRFDHEFHDLIARGTHNMMFVKLSEMLTELLMYYQSEEKHNLGFDHALKYHKLILEAIQEKNEELAFIYCRIHIDNAIRHNRVEMALEP